MDCQRAMSKWNPEIIKAWFWYIKLWEGTEHQIFSREIKNTQNKSETEHAYPKSHKRNEWPIISTPINKPNTQKNSWKWELINVEMENKELANSHTWNAHFKQRVGWLPAALLPLLQLWSFLWSFLTPVFPQVPLPHWMSSFFSCPLFLFMPCCYPPHAPYVLLPVASTSSLLPLLSVPFGRPKTALFTSHLAAQYSSFSGW